MDLLPVSVYSHELLPVSFLHYLILPLPLMHYSCPCLHVFLKPEPEKICLVKAKRQITGPKRLSYNTTLTKIQLKVTIGERKKS